MTKNNKEKTIINSLAGVMAVITILAIFAVVILRQTAAQEEKDQKLQNARRVVIGRLHLPVGLAAQQHGLRTEAV